MSKRITLSEHRLQKLYNDVAEEVTKARIASLRNQGYWSASASGRDNELYKLEVAVSDVAVRSLSEPIERREPKHDD